MRKQEIYVSAESMIFELRVIASLLLEHNTTLSHSEQTLAAYRLSTELIRSIEDVTSNLLPSPSRNTASEDGLGPAHEC